MTGLLQKMKEEYKEVMEFHSGCMKSVLPNTDCKYYHHHKYMFEYFRGCYDTIIRMEEKLWI